MCSHLVILLFAGSDFLSFMGFSQGSVSLKMVGNSLRKEQPCFSTLMISCSISVHWLWDDFLCFFRLFHSNTCWSALGLVSHNESLQWLSCSLELLMGSWVLLYNPPMGTITNLSLRSGSQEGAGPLSHAQRGFGFSHSKTPSAVSSSGFAPRAAELILPLQHPSDQHSVSLSLSNPLWCSVLPGRCWAPTSTCLSENGECSASLPHDSIFAWHSFQTHQTL